MMHRAGYFAFWFWYFIKDQERIDHCEDGPHCGCDQHRGGWDDDE